MQAKELEREAARKRQEKVADQKARAAVKAQIEVSLWYHSTS
jgi:hypothetical protein